VFQKKGITSNKKYTGIDYVYKFDATLKKMPDCLMANQNTLRNQAYVVVNQLRWIFHHIKTTAGMFLKLNTNKGSL